jgi:hypothetical protein
VERYTWLSPDFRIFSIEHHLQKQFDSLDNLLVRQSTRFHLARNAVLPTEHMRTANPNLQTVTIS